MRTFVRIVYGKSYRTIYIVCPKFIYIHVLIRISFFFRYTKKIFPCKLKILWSHIGYKTLQKKNNDTSRIFMIIITKLIINVMISRMIFP